ncbi:MAG: DnaJ domain-containing protein [Chloroflexota bacterium]
MPAKDPHVVLGDEPGAAPEEITAAWRRLARSNHPDLTGDDPVASRRATRRMAEINTAYATLTRGAARPTDSPTNGSANGQRPRPGSADGTRTSGPPRQRPARPVTGRLDTTDTFRPRNQTTTRPGSPHPLRGQPPLRADRRPADLRASEPTGPTVRGVAVGHRPPAAPDLDDALDHELDFGKFRGHTLGQVAAFEPSYIDWLAATVSRDPEMGAAARVVRDELDRRGIIRAQRPIRPGWRSNPFV